MTTARPAPSLHRLHVALCGHSIMVRAHFSETIRAVLADPTDKDNKKSHALADAVTRAIDNDLSGLEALKTAENYSARERAAVKNLLSAFGLS